MNLNKIDRLVGLFCALASESNNYLKNILKKLETLDTYNARKEYAEKNLKHLSSGSSRLVYETDNHTIIKLAKNDKGIAQNKAEANPEMKSPFLNKILKKAKDFSWIETYFLDKITEKDFKKMTGVKFSDFGDAIRYGLKDISGSSKEKPDNFEKVSHSEIYKEMKKIGEKFDLMPGDIARISSWGCRNNHPVLIDAGLTKKVFKKYYED